MPLSLFRLSHGAIGLRKRPRIRLQCPGQILILHGQNFPGAGGTPKKSHRPFPVLSLCCPLRATAPQHQPAAVLDGGPELSNGSRCKWRTCPSRAQDFTQDRRPHQPQVSLHLQGNGPIPADFHASRKDAGVERLRAFSHWREKGLEITLRKKARVPSIAADGPGADGFFKITLDLRQA